MPVNIICEWRFLGDLGGANWECAIKLITSKIIHSDDKFDLLFSI